MLIDKIKLTLNIFSKCLSFVVAGLDICAFYFLHQHIKSIRFGEPLWGEQGEFVISIVGTIIIVGGPMALIWFAEHISDFAEQRTEWAPTGLIVFAGWFFLLIPATLFILCKMKIISL